MKNDILDESELTDEIEPLTVNETVINLLQDLIADNPPDDIATDFIENFILIEREETPHILGMLDAPTPTIIEMLKQVVAAGYEAQLTALDTKGFAFIQGVKQSVKSQLTALAAESES